MAKATGQRKPGTIETRTQDPVPEQARQPEAAETGDTERLTAALAPAYRTYLQGRKDLAQAFKEREYRDQEAYKDAERRYRLCAEAIEKAARTREKAELDASDYYREDIDKAIDKALQVYKDKTKQALAECKQRVIDAWKTSMGSSDQTAGVCEETIEKAMKAREKAETDALYAYRQDVDRAVERASQGHKERLSAALSDCRQRVTAAWKTSMETSARMTGVFEEDTDARQGGQPVEAIQELPRTQLREMMVRMKTGLESAFRKVGKATWARHSR